MAINKHDDYEALAKLLYPSIEASGNVYYGQTRKLTLDEVLKRNSLGFDSHIESFYNESNSRYDSYFCWRLGSLHGSILVDIGRHVDGITASDFSVPFIKRILYADSEEIIYDDKLIYYMAKPNEGYALDTSMVPIFGTIFAKYRLDKRSTTITNELNSGSYDSYEVDVEPVLEGIYVTDDFNPVNSIDDDISERHFYISKEKGVDYLYIQILTNEDTSKILTFTALEDSEISLSLVQRTDVQLRPVSYRVSQDDGSFTDDWELYHYDWSVGVAPTGPISLNTGRKIQFKSDITGIGPMPNNANDCLKFVINSGTLFVSGSCISMCHPDTDESTIDTLDDYALYGLFSDVKNMYGTPVLPNVNKLGSGCYAHMFENCGSLTVAPKIKSSDTYSYISENYNYCYSFMFSGCVSLVSPPKMMGYNETDQYYQSGIGTCDSMFIGCTSLKISPVIRYRTLGSSSCRDMFYGCSSLKLIRCGAKYLASSATKSWVYGVSKNGVFIKSTTEYMSYQSGPDGIPEGWAVVTKDDDYFTVHKEPDHGFRIDKHTPSDNYKNDYLVTSGTDSSTNGRGYIANVAGKESTIGKMERSFDENNTHPMNTYNADGSFNQEIWGYKSFNSPVKFRNGLYGEDWSLYTYDGSQNTDSQQSSSPITTMTADNIAVAAKNVTVGLNSGRSNINPANDLVSLGSSIPFASIRANIFYGLLPHPLRESTATLGNREPEYSTQLLYLTYNTYDQAGHLDDHNHDLTFEIITLKGYTTYLTIRSNDSNSSWSYLMCYVNGSAHAITFINSLEVKIDNLHKGDIITFYTTKDIADGVKFKFHAPYGTYANVSGNPASMYYKNDDHANYSRVTRDSAFEEMFNPPINYGFIYDASKLYIMGTGENLCKRMFYNNYTLEYPPLAMWCEGNGCCYEMFASSSVCYTPVNCSSNSYQYMYYKMFDSCTDLKYGAFMVSLAASAVNSMFSSCSNLKEISILRTDQTFSAMDSSIIDSYGYNNLAPVPSESDPSQTVTNARVYSTFINANIQNSVMRDLSIEAAIYASHNMIPGDKVRITHYDYDVLELYSASLRINSSTMPTSSIVQPRAGDILGGSYILLSSIRDRGAIQETQVLYDCIVMGVRSEK